MKKVILTAAALIAFSSTAQAGVSNPVHEAKAKEYIEIAYPIVDVVFACKVERRHEYLEYVMNMAYLSAEATSDSERSIVDMWYTINAMGNHTLTKAVNVVKKYPNDNSVIEYCVNQTAHVDETLARGRPWE